MTTPCNKLNNVSIAVIKSTAYVKFVCAVDRICFQKKIYYAKMRNYSLHCFNFPSRK